MALSNRERLKAASRRNTEKQEQIEEPTLITSMIERLDAEPEPINQADVVNGLSGEEQKDSKASDAIIGRKIISSNSPENNYTESKEKRVERIASLNKMNYGGKDIKVALLLSEEADEFLAYVAIEKQISIKQFFREIMINEIENGIPNNDDLAKLYRRVRHGTVKRTVSITEELRSAIKDTAVKYHMKYTSFMAYAVEKSRIEFYK